MKGWMDGVTDEYGKMDESTNGKTGGNARPIFKYTYTNVQNTWESRNNEESRHKAGAVNNDRFRRQQRDTKHFLSEVELTFVTLTSSNHPMKRLTTVLSSEECAE